MTEARAGIGNYFRFYNQERLHQSLDYRTPAAIYLAGLANAMTDKSIRNEALLTRGLCPRTPGIYRFRARMAGLTLKELDGG